MILKSPRYSELLLLLFIPLEIAILLTGFSCVSSASIPQPQPALGGNPNQSSQKSRTPSGQVGTVTLIDIPNNRIVILELPNCTVGKQLCVFRGTEQIATAVVESVIGVDNVTAKVPNPAELSQIKKGDKVLPANKYVQFANETTFAGVTADRVYLKSGQVLVGIIVSQNVDTVYFDTAITKNQPISREQIDHIVRTGHPEIWYIEQGEKALKAERYDTALHLFEKALKWNPNSTLAKERWKYTYWQKIKSSELIRADALFSEPNYHSGIASGAYDKALQTYDELTEKYAGKPFLDELYRQIAILHLEMAKKHRNYVNSKKAEDEVNIALALDSTNATAHEFYAQIMEERGKWRVAANEYMLAKEIKPQLKFTPAQQQLITYAENTYRQEWAAVAKLKQKPISPEKMRALTAKLDVYDISLAEYTDATGILLQAYNAGQGAVRRYNGAVNYPLDPDPVRYVAWVKSRIPYDKFKPKTRTNSQYDELIYRLATKYRLDFDLVKAVISVESGFDNTAQHEQSKCSGLMQLARQTWDWICRDIINQNWNYESSWSNPEKNIEVGCAYFNWLKYQELPHYFPDKFSRR